MNIFRLVKLLDPISISIDSNGILSKYDATAPPSVTDDDVAGYSVGSHWVDVTGDEVYVCVDASTGAAIWKRVSDDSDLGIEWNKMILINM